MTSRSLRAICAACIAVGTLHLLSVSFSTTTRIARRAAYQSGKLNVGAEVSDMDTPPPPPPVLECDEGCMTAIFDCLDEGCSVDALLKLDQQLADDEKKILENVKEIETVQKTAYSQENAGTLAWLKNFLSRSGSLRAQLQALKGVKDSDFIEQMVKAASVAFGGGRPNDYPKVGVSPYSS
mmetsp:Transcript_2985/g.3355  ORF Transcript_2985/g.3355 Transcript_2985/m.3355 type:complete len:181 (+) Transcript_2985:84-626(+)|eukprot:Skav208756  [mRNA]  locus=scaffold1871:217326:217868:+ [translate_table: standard]